MLTVLVATTKGGCGKTTTATNLAAALAGAGHRAVLADADRQRSSLGWLERRPATAPAIDGLDWSRSLGKPPKADFLIIDAPAGLRAKEVKELVQFADAIVVPVLPSAFDEAATERFLDRLEELRPIAKRRKPVAILGNRVRTGTRSADRLEAFFASIGHPVIARLRDSQAYVEAAGSGLGIFDRQNQRALMLREEWQPLLAFVDDADR
jgi:chromosome partitioning protein